MVKILILLMTALLAFQEVSGECSGNTLLTCRDADVDGDCCFWCGQSEINGTCYFAQFTNKCPSSFCPEEMPSMDCGCDSAADNLGWNVMLLMGTMILIQNLIGV